MCTSVSVVYIIITSCYYYYYRDFSNFFYEPCMIGRTQRGLFSPPSDVERVCRGLKTRSLIFQHYQHNIVVYNIVQSVGTNITTEFILQYKYTIVYDIKNNRFTRTNYIDNLKVSYFVCNIYVPTLWER